MTKSRVTQINIESTPWYHLLNRCVRKAYLCGADKYTKQNFDHRRQWMVDRIRLLSSTFTIDVASYAIMSNHYHIVVRVNVDEQKNLSDIEVARRWQRLYRGHPMMTAWLKGEDHDRLVVNKLLKEWRKRLGDISWFMRCLNEYMAHMANFEDKCTGKFWEGRFKSQALMDEKAIVSCMAYVDLNPIRANMSDSVEDSEYTSIYERIHEKSSQVDEHALETEHDFPIKKLLPFDASQNKKSNGIAFSLISYLELVDLTGRVIREDKSGHISYRKFGHQQPRLLKQLGICEEHWVHLSKHFGKTGKKRRLTAIGTKEELNDISLALGKRFISGQNEVSNIFQ